MALSFSFGYYAMHKSSKPLLITFDLINKYQDFKYISNNDENFFRFGYISPKDCSICKL